MPSPASIFAALPNPGVAGVIDIVLVSFLIYQALMVVRGTRAGHVLVGILFIVGLYAAAWWLNLSALSAILANIVPYLGLAIVVLFQSEIRRTLARLGRRRFLGFGSGFRPEGFTDEIVLAVEHLAQHKTGALIVLERDIGLRTFIESGVRLEARLSRDLLISIFYPEVPLHDGACIVQKDRVAAAACFLPLTTNPALSSQFGTRHRAAIGITEETDCLAIVVSEETGRISAAKQGELVSGLTAEQLTARINAHFSVQQRAQAHLEEATDGSADHGAAAHGAGKAARE
jgi:diadenylate cyclase